MFGGVHILKKLSVKALSLFIVLLGVSMLAFGFSIFADDNQAENLARLQTFNPSPEVIEGIREEFHLDAPIPVRYGIWLKGLLKGDLGKSYMTRSSVYGNLKKYLPKTLILSGLSLLVTILCTLPLGLMCAKYRNKFLDHFTKMTTIIGICLPVFWLGFLLLIAFAIQIPIFTVAPQGGIKGYILPCITLSVPMICSGIRIFRTQLITELTSDYAVYLRSRGFSKRYILYKHCFRNALPPMISWFASYAGYLIAGSAVVESVFSIKGMGNHLVEAVIARDIPTISASVLVVAFVFVVFNFLADGINLAICPRTIGGEND